MKLASSVAKLPIVSMNEGEQIAIVKDLYISRKTKKVEYLTVVKKAEDIIPSVLFFKDITGIGNDFIVVKSLDNIKEIHLNDKLIASLEEGITITGRMVLSSTGDVLGTISEYVINTKTGGVAKITLDNQQEIEGDKLVTLSAKFIVVDESGEAAAAKSSLDDASLAYLVGKTVTADVVSGDGSFTITQGTVLSQELIAQAESHDMLVQLTMAV